jgi:isoquinoline 1-oxidoreductase beta subunit
MNTMNNPSRREFLQAFAVTGGSLVIGYAFPGMALAGPDVKPDGAARTFAPNPYVRIGTDNIITVVCGKSEMGQGILTGLAQLVAEELDADWATVRAEQAPASLDYANPGTPLMATGGSTSIRANWVRLRTAGAAARAMLVEAAARKWGVDKIEVRTQKGLLLGPGGRKARYGEFAEAAAAISPPQNPPLKKAADFTLIGQALPRLDTAQKINGKAQFGIDIRLPGMLVAVIAFPPRFGAKMQSFDGSAVFKTAGVRGVYPVSGGVAVVADNMWAALNGRNALKVEWGEGIVDRFSMDDIRKSYADALDRPGLTDVSQGRVQHPEGARTVVREFEQPFLVQAPMEPMTCTVDIRENEAQVWTGTQQQTLTQRRVAEIAGLKPEQVKVHTTFLGGAFGRRGVSDFVVNAAEIAKAAGRPVKLVYTREDDMRAGYYRPFNRIRVSGTLDDKGGLASLSAKTAVPSISKWTGFSFLKKPNGVDLYATEALHPPYTIPNVDVQWVEQDLGIPIWFWRTPGGNQNCFAIESTIDDLAHAAQKDPLAFRRALLEGKPRQRAVLELAAAKSAWGSPLPKGMGRGFAMVEIFGTVVAQVAEVRVEGKSLRVERVVCAIDCGTVINPQQVRAQAESSIVYGLSALLYGQATIEKGAVQQSNFHDYQVLRMSELPKIEVHLIESDAPPGGMGEPATPPILPAVANAVFQVTGKRVTRLPLTLG